VNAFEFSNVRKITFGRSTCEQVGALAAARGARAILVTNAGDQGANGVTDKIVGVLEATRLTVTVYRQRGEPTVETVNDAVELARRNACDVVVGLGGGSAIDAAKAVAGLMTNGGGPLDYMEVIGKGRKLEKPAAPWFAMPTTAGTGAEVTRNSVIGCPQKSFKASLRSEHLLASAAIIDPELGRDVSAAVTARGGMDAVCQLIESYTSHRASPMTDGLALTGLKHATASLETAVSDGGNIDAREGMALAAMLSGITLANAGLGAAHGFASPMGANFPIPHGTVCGLLLPAVMRANVTALSAESPDHPWISRYATIGRILIGNESADEQTAIDGGIERIEQWVKMFKLPGLRHFGVGEDRLSEIVALAMKSSSMKYNPVRLSERTLADILVRSLGARG
jgi:alcohol dehydrogenase class IV